MKRIIKITMDINEDTHAAEVSSVVTENGKIKKEWTPPQGVSTALALIESARALLNDLNDYMIDVLKQKTEEEQK